MHFYQDKKPFQNVSPKPTVKDSSLNLSSSQSSASLEPVKAATIVANAPVIAAAANVLPQQIVKQTDNDGASAKKEVASSATSSFVESKVPEEKKIPVPAVITPTVAIEKNNLHGKSINDLGTRVTPSPAPSDDMTADHDRDPSMMDRELVELGSLCKKRLLGMCNILHNLYSDVAYLICI